MTKILRSSSNYGGQAIARTAMALSLVTLVASPAAAQFFNGYNTPMPPGAYGRTAPVFRGYARPISPDDIVERLEDRGFDDVSRPRFDGSNYLVEATNPRGLRVRLVVDAFRGNVVDRIALGRPGEEGFDGSPPTTRFAPRGQDERGWFGNNLQPPDDRPVARRRLVPDDAPERSARIEQPGAIEVAPLDGPRGRIDPPRPALRDPALPRTPPDRAVSLPKPIRPTEGAAPSRVDGGNPDAFKGEQRRPNAAVSPPATPSIATPSTVARTSPPAPALPTADIPDEPPKGATKPDGLSPIHPLRPQTVPETSAQAPSETGEGAVRPPRNVRIIGGVTPVPGAPSADGRNTGPITADSDTVKP